MKRTAKYLQARAEGAARKAERSAAAKKGRETRALEMSALYRQGVTLNEIGARYGITRERVRQLMTEFGVTRADGGATVKAAKNREARIERLNSRCLAKHGMTLEEYRAAPKRARSAYCQQKRNAGTRGIEWRMNFAEWWSVWKLSGKWEQRGRGAGYVMGRKGDSGPYSIENVYVCTASQNVKDGYIWKPAHLRKRRLRNGKPPAVYEYAGKALPLHMWAQETGISANTLNGRIKRGWPLDRALSEPLISTNTHLLRLSRQSEVRA